MKKKIDIHLFDENPLYLSKLPTYFYHICCDCGLRHLVVVERHGKGIRIGFALDYYGTKEVRKVERLEKELKKKKENL